ncbi:MAG: DUF1330 domain-containing protein [Actinomycetota bacterium]
MFHIDANEEALEAMRQADPSQPIVMLNLLRFREQALDGFGVDGLTGLQAFQRYGQMNEADDVRYGSEPVWLGPAHRTIIGDEQWDLAILVRYPTRQHFIDKLDDPTYREISLVRAAALIDSRLIELTQLLPALS